MLAEAWRATATAADASPPRWIEETRTVPARAAAPGYLALDEHLSVPHAHSVPARDDDDDRSTHDEDDEEEMNEEEEDELAVAPREVPAGALVLSYHVVYSRSYGVPVLLVAARRAAPPATALSHAELTAALVRAACSVGDGGGDVSDGRSSRSSRLLVGGLDDLTVFAPWEHPHLTPGGCWLGVHPCRTSEAMALLMATPEVTRKVDGDGDGDAPPPLRYMLAWIRLAATAVVHLPVPPRTALASVR